MSDVFFEELGVAHPITCSVGSGSHAAADRARDRAPGAVARARPDLVLVPGDVNSTLAAALTA